MNATWRAGVVMAFVLAVLPAAAPGADDGRIERAALFERGKGEFPVYRIPSLVVTAKGTLLACCEARSERGGDWDDSRVVLRRSTDGGRTWAEPRVVSRVDGPLTRNPAAVAKHFARPGEYVHNNPVLIADPKSGAVHLLYCGDYMRCFYRRSDDDGVTFADPVEITAVFDAFRPDYDWEVLATGPAHGIVLRTGRLLVPVWLSTGTGGGAHRPSVVSTIYSDDAGRTWRRGEIVARETDPLVNPSETIAIELADGRVMLNLRSESRENRRAIAVSPDGATHWSRPAFDDALAEPICMAAICRLSGADGKGRTRILFANPDNLDRDGKPGRPGESRDRRNLTVKLSYDEGRTWPVSRVVEPGTAAYCDLAVGPDGTIYCLYEGGRTAALPAGLILARFDLQWLTEGRDRLPATRSAGP